MSRGLLRMTYKPTRCVRGGASLMVRFGSPSRSLTGSRPARERPTARLCSQATGWATQHERKS